MIEVGSLLKIDEGFVAIGEYHGAISEPDYVEGVMMLAVDGVVLLDERDWDLIDLLWHYVITVLEDLARSGSGETMFPDQQVVLRFERLGDHRVLISYLVPGQTPVTAQCRLDELYSAMIAAGRHFFGEMIRLDPSGERFHREGLDRLDALVVPAP